jgi:hypothetical protein
MRKSRKLGIAEYQTSDDVFFDLFARLRQKRIVPQGKIDRLWWSRNKGDL